MISVQNLPTDHLANQIADLSEQKFTGKLEIASSQIHWSLFYCLGRLVWATGGTHPNWRFQRITQTIVPQVSWTQITMRESDRPQCENYHRLTILSRRNELTQQQTITIVEETLKEVLFDILHHQSTTPLDYHHYPEEGLEKADTLMFALVRPEMILAAAQVQWESWQEAGLGAYSPNLGPIIIQKEELQKQTSSQTYQNLIKFLDGQHTLRDLAFLLQKDLKQVSLSLMPYLHQELIQFISVPELPRLNTPRPTTKDNLAKKPLVVCIDDSPIVASQMEEIITKAGYRYLSIQDSVKALPKLLETKPSLIFLDLVMPIANGYEICTWIRRVSAFKDIPIVILTGRDGIVDRVRANLVGATGFLPKPVTQETVLATVKKYISV